MSMFGIDIVNAQGGFLNEQQYLQGKAGYISPAMDTALLDIKRKKFLEDQLKQKQLLQNQGLLSSIMAIPKDANKTFDITEMDKIRQSISSKILGAQQLRIPITGV